MLMQLVPAIVVAVILAGAVPPVASDNLSDCVQSADPALSISGCTKVISCGGSKGSDLSWAYNNRGAAHANQGDFDHAITDYTKAIDLDPEYAIAYYNRGFSFRHKGDGDAAIADWSAAFRLKPDFAKIFRKCDQAPDNGGETCCSVVDCVKPHQIDPSLKC